MSWRDWTQKTIAMPISKPAEFWRRSGPDVYTCVDPAGYEKDPAVTAAIHEFDPGVIPFCRIQTWLPPGECRPLTVVHHGIGRHYPHPRYHRAAFRVEMPQDPGHEVLNYLDCIFEDAESTGGIGPAGYLPWDWTAYAWCRRNFIALTPEKLLEIVEAAERRKDAELQAWSDDLERSREDFSRFAARKLEAVSERDWIDYQALVRGRAKGRKPFVHLRQREVAPSPATTHGVAPRGRV